MNNKIIFLEFREDAEYFTETLAGGLAAGTFQVVALDDDACLYLSNKGISYIHVEELLPPSLEGILCGEIWHRLEAFCKYVDGVLVGQLDFLEKETPYLASQVEVLKVMFDALILKVEILRNVFERLRPQEIYFARNDLVQSTHHRLFFDESFSLYSVLMEYQLAEIAGYSPKTTTWRSQYRIGSASARDRVSKWWYRLARAGSHIAVSLQRRAVHADPRGPTVCVIGGGERSLLSVIDALRARGAQITEWRPQTAVAPAPYGTSWARAWRVIRNIAVYRQYQIKLERAWPVLAGAPEFLAFFNWRGVDLSSIILQRVYIAVTRNVAHQQVSMNEAKLLLRKTDILLSSYYSTFERPIAHLARRLNKKVVSVQHGAMGHDEGGYDWGLQGNPLRASNKGFFYTDMAEADIKLTWGIGAAKEMSGWRFCNHHPRLEVMGAPHLTFLKGSRGQGNSSRKRILYVSNAFGNNTYSLMNLRGVGYRSRQYQIVRALAANSADHEIIYKAYSFWTRNEVYSRVRSQFSSKRMTYCGGEKRLPDLFKEVDCVVLDLPTTGFYEACVTRLPVFLFNVACTFSDDVMGMINRRAYYSENIEEFCGMLDRYQTNPADFPTLEDDSFVKTFCDVDKKTDIMALISGGSASAIIA